VRFISGIAKILQWRGTLEVGLGAQHPAAGVHCGDWGPVMDLEKGGPGAKP